MEEALLSSNLHGMVWLFLTEVDLLLQTLLNDNWYIAFKVFVPTFVLGVLLSLSDSSHIDASGPPLGGVPE